MNFANEIFAVAPGAPITAVFRNGESVEYTMNIFSLLKTDPSVECIYDSETGEVIFAQ